MRDEQQQVQEEEHVSSIERAQEAAMARRAIDALPERDRLALLLREEGLDYNEIAASLELAPGSVGTTLSRARRKLVESYETLQAEMRRREGHAAS
jgi:RNA polymerase sigma-70 factor (ECF subfamily)